MQPLEIAKQSLDKIIAKARVHLYKPIQIAEILHHARIVATIDLRNIESYRTQSRKWQCNFRGSCKRNCR
jgi:HaeII restriction endonuclease